MIKIVEDFIIRKKLICYGGTAINNILPERDQFYNKRRDPGFFFSSNALDDAKELADIYHKAGFKSIEAKSGHFGTFKVFVNYIPIADITSVGPEIYKTLLDDAVSCGNPLLSSRLPSHEYVLELSAAGDTSRWEKVSTRLSLLNKNYSMNTNDKCGELAKKINSEDNKAFSKTYEIQRRLDKSRCDILRRFRSESVCQIHDQRRKNWLTISAKLRSFTKTLRGARIF
jgi:hypothetical protein